MNLMDYILICVFVIAWVIMIAIIVKKYPPKVPQILGTYIPAELLEINVLNTQTYQFENVRYIQDEKFFKIYLDNDTKILFRIETIVFIKITTDNVITKTITKTITK